MTIDWQPDYRHLETVMAQMQGRKILVIGDVQLDVYLVGQATRLSREAPVPVLEFTRRFSIPGAAANPAANIASLGGQTTLIGLTGVDEGAGELKMALTERGIGSAGLIGEQTIPTVTKMRIVAEDGTRARQQLCRVDWLVPGGIPVSAHKALIERITDLLPEHEMIVISDYRSGVMDAEVMAAIHRANRDRQIPVVVDPQGNMQLYAGCLLLKCNDAEASAQLQTKLETEAQFVEGCFRLCRELGVQAAVITRSSDGMSIGGGELWNEPAYLHLPVRNVEPADVIDVTGAGDTVVAVMALALAAGATLLEAAYLANTAAQLVVRRLGNATLTPHELSVALRKTLDNM